ncbi:hypothetical protein N7462_005941 [Penicillium macrosclerotiorum]|uniref:uncharacterized protein n=1 Tax=Penicillium macrosclerotiorum TaxID=303699 RepID=UPI0025486689|nr:uncharacterized protein N7462_005941 [Penicillium macrosclerotiorum]KAJ5682776.1 hypothetical protein N7462_005941 [Penicillium macrosclerotiorum]
MALLFAYWQYNVARLEGQPDALTKIEKLALPLRFPYYLESRNYKRKDSSTLLRQVDLNPSNVPNYTDLFDKFKKSSMETSSPQLTQWMNQTYNEGFFRELNVADAIILCKKIAGVADKAGKADKLADVKFLEGQTKDEGWLKQLNSDVEEFKGILTGKTKKKEKRKKKDDSESKKKPKKKPNFDEEVNEFRDLRIQQYLAIMMLKEYWGFISSMDANYGRKQLGKPGYKQPRYLWTRSCDNTLLDGRVVPFVSNQEGLPIREEPTTNPNGSVTMQMNIEVPSISPLSQEQAADEGQQIQAKNLSDFIDANLSIVIDEFDWSDEIRSEGDYSESETEEDSKEASLISGRRGWVGGKDISKTRVVERGETERLAVRTRKFR